MDGTGSSTLFQRSILTLQYSIQHLRTSSCALLLPYPSTDLRLSLSVKSRMVLGRCLRTLPYDNTESISGIRRYMLAHIQNLDLTPTDIERSGFTISGLKSELAVSRFRIVGFICNERGRYCAMISFLHVFRPFLLNSKHLFSVSANEARLSDRHAVRYLDVRATSSYQLV